MDPLGHRLFVGGLPKACDDSQLRAYFGKFGAMTDCGVVVDKAARCSRGFGFVTYESAAAAELVLKSSDDHVIGGKWVDAKPCLAFSTSKKRKSKKDKRRGKISASPAAQLADVAAGPQGYQLLKCYHCRQPGTEVSCSDCFRRFCWQCVSTCNRCSREQCEACCSTHDQVCRTYHTITGPYEIGHQLHAHCYPLQQPPHNRCRGRCQRNSARGWPCGHPCDKDKNHDPPHTCVYHMSREDDSESDGIEEKEALVCMACMTKGTEQADAVYSAVGATESGTRWLCFSHLAGLFCEFGACILSRETRAGDRWIATSNPERARPLFFSR